MREAQARCYLVRPHSHPSIIMSVRRTFLTPRALMTCTSGSRSKGSAGSISAHAQQTRDDRRIRHAAHFSRHRCPCAASAHLEARSSSRMQSSSPPAAVHKAAPTDETALLKRKADEAPSSAKEPSNASRKVGYVYSAQCIDSASKIVVHRGRVQPRSHSTFAHLCIGKSCALTH